MKLNLGCGQNKVEGYVNVDRAHDPDQKVDLEAFPWPWADSSVEMIRAHHILEHLGKDTEVFIGVMKEIYRVCKNGAKVEIVVPHPRHDDFMNDPTHVRPITLNVLALFSKKWNEKWVEDGSANTKLALEHGIDLEPISEAIQLDPHIQAAHDARPIPEEVMKQLIRERNNIVKSLFITLQVNKE